jgi:hypothetical protein
MVINRLKATKSLLDEQVNDEESSILEILMANKTKIQNQREGLKIASIISNLTKMKTQNLSLMNELQSGLLKQVSELK